MFVLFMLTQDWISRRLQAAKDRQSGAAAVEYGLLIGLIAVAIIAVLVVLGPKLAALFNQVNTQLPAGTPVTG